MFRFFREATKTNALWMHVGRVRWPVQICTGLAVRSWLIGVIRIGGGIEYVPARDARIQELLEANTRYVERAREVETDLMTALSIIKPLAAEADYLCPYEEDPECNDEREPIGQELMGRDALRAARFRDAMLEKYGDRAFQAVGV